MDRVMSSKPRQQFDSEIVIVPDPQVRSEVFLIARDTKKSGSAIYFSRDGGKTFVTMIPAPTSKDRVGSVLTLAEGGSAAWKFQEPKGSTSASSAGTPRVFVPFNLVGNLAVNSVFGYFKVPIGKTAVMHEIQIVVQDAADQPITVDVVNGSGVAQGRSGTLSVGGLHTTFVFPTPLRMVGRSIWSMKVLGCGTSGASGQNLTVLAGIEYQS